MADLASQAYLLVQIATEFEVAESNSNPRIRGREISEVVNRWHELPEEVLSEARSLGLEQECFPADTSITLADGTTKPISDIRMGDEVLSFKPNGSLVSGRVTQLLENVTTEWVKLTRADDHDFELVATPGHHFLRPGGSFAAIADIIADDGRIVHVDGSVITVEAERIAYSTDTAHLYEQHAMRKTWTSGGLAMAPEHIEGWRTYNFAILETHKYAATQDARHAT